DYLAEKGIPTSDFIQSCLEQIDPNLFGASGPTDQSPVCRACGLQFLSRLAYQQRVAISRDELPATVTSRPDCYYGRKCRTQRTSISHAYRYNHICEQTRF
ncbi:E3 ubiquitin-protein ligase CHFR, partial [Fasciolopsis buskii]